MSARGTSESGWRTALVAAIAPKILTRARHLDAFLAQARAIGLDDEQTVRVIRNGVTLEALGASHLVDVFARVGASNAITSQDLHQLASRGIRLHLGTYGTS